MMDREKPDTETETFEVESRFGKVEVREERKGLFVIDFPE